MDPSPAKLAKWMSFAILHFKIENSVAVVPVCWLGEKPETCYWPNHLRATRLEMSVKQREPPNDDWECLTEARVLHRYDTYAQARSNLACAELDTSALDSDYVKNPEQIKRKCKTVFSDWVDSDDDEFIEPVSSDLPKPGLQCYNNIVFYY
nr:uncharacterized protein LOC124812994 [Hydra vulgaris]